VINLRYHIVSIVAVFLALGIGVALGSSFVDGFVVDQLTRNVDALEVDRAELREQVTELNTELEESAAQHQQDLESIAPVNQLGRLGGVPVMLMVSDGVDLDAWMAVRDSIVATDATYEGTIFLTDNLDMTIESNRIELADTFGLVNSDESLVRPALMLRLNSALFPDSPDGAAALLGGVAGDVVGELLDSDGGVSTTAAPAEPELSSVLVALRDRGFIRHDTELASTGALEALPTFGTLFIMMSSAQADLPAAEFLLPLLADAVDDAPANRLIAVEPSPTEDGVSGVEFVGPIRADAEMRGRISTIDSVDSYSGLLSLVAVADAEGIYQLGSDLSANSSLPRP
jgi:hypothetical protein